MWTANFAHGIVATAHCFGTANVDYSTLAASKYTEMTLGGYTNYDKLLFAVPLWFGLGFTNLYFSKKVYGNFNLPWDLLKADVAVAAEEKPLA